jgi:hypothetical protein
MGLVDLSLSDSNQIVQRLRQINTLRAISTSDN